MLNKTLAIIAAGASLAALSACTGLAVRTDVNPAYPVVSCHTYAFANEHLANSDQPAAYANPLNADRLRTAIAANLAARGIQPVERNAAECVVGYAMGSRQVFNDFYGGFGPGVGFGGWGYGWGGGYYGGWGWDGPLVQDETRISVDLFDAKSRAPMWHASVTQTVSELTGPNAVEKINAAAAAIFSKFPAGVPAPVPVPAPAAGRAT